MSADEAALEPDSLQAAAGEFKVFLRLKRYGKALTALQRAWKAAALKKRRQGWLWQPERYKDDER